MAEEDISLFSRPPRRKSKSKLKKETKSVAEHNNEHPTARTSPEPAAELANSVHDCLPEPQQDASFRSLGLTEWMSSVCSTLGMRSPTGVQRACLPAILSRRDVIAISHTGTGKTAAFALPILQLLAKDSYGIFALVLTPTRELALQLADHFRALAAGMSLRDAVVIGGVDDQSQASALNQRPHLVIATPGRLASLLDSDASLAAHFSKTAIVVLDEADRMLDATFETELGTVLAAVPEQRQTLLFSATMTTTLRSLQRSLLHDAFFYEAYAGLETAKRLREEYLLVPHKVKDVYLVWLLENLEALEAKSAIVFASTKHNCALLGHLLAELGVRAACLHAGRSQRERVAALDRFRAGTVPVLVATDVASRGLDIPDVDLVINYDLPLLARDYVHRVGRTARAGRQGWSLSFVTQYDVRLVHAIEELTGKQLEAYKAPEKEVLQEITRVYAARRMAGLRVAEEEEEASLRPGNLRWAKEKKEKRARDQSRKHEEDWLLARKKMRDGDSGSGQE